jgi:hypothetical protein
MPWVGILQAKHTLRTSDPGVYRGLALEVNRISIRLSASAASIHVMDEQDGTTDSLDDGTDPRDAAIPLFVCMSFFVCTALSICTAFSVCSVLGSGAGVAGSSNHDQFPVLPVLCFLETQQIDAARDGNA